MDLGCAPPADLRPAVQEHFHQTNHPCVLNFDPGDLHSAGRDRQRQLLKEREVHMDIEGFGFEGGKSLRNGSQGLGEGVQGTEGLAAAEIPQGVYEGCHPEERRKLFVHAQDGALAAGAEDVMAVLNLFQHALQLSPEPLIDTEAEDLRDLVRQQAQQSDVARPLEQLVDGEVATEDQVEAVLDLLDGIVAAQVDRLPILTRELRSDEPCPVVQAFADDIGAQPVGGRLQRFRIVNGQKGAVVLAKADALAKEFLLDIVMPVQIVRNLKRQKEPDTQGQGSQHRAPM